MAPAEFAASTSSMARRLRIQYSGARYHGINRGKQLHMGKPASVRVYLSRGINN